MLRFVYTVAVYLATPVFVWRLLARGAHYRDSLRRWRERFGWFPDTGLHGCIWVHAVSVGEVNAVASLVEALLRRHAPRALVLTTLTATGSQRAQELFGDRVLHVYLPYDLPGAVRRFLDRLRPAFAVVMETEIWPNLLHGCGRRGIPLALVNARLSERLVRGPRLIRSLMRQALGNVALVAAQSQPDANRYRLLGAKPGAVHVTGNLKFDLPVPPTVRGEGAALRARWGPARRVWIAASIHAGEEEAVFAAHRLLLTRVPDALLLIAARHPERFRALERAAREAGFTLANHGAADAGAGTECLVIDAMGVLMDYYAAADVAFVGGSLVPVGGHNVLEPAALSKPVLVGPHTFNFEAITAALIESGGARRVASARELGESLVGMLQDAGQLAQMGAAAHAVYRRDQGAVERTMALLAPLSAGIDRRGDAGGPSAATAR